MPELPSQTLGDRDRELIQESAALLAADLSLGEFFERLCGVISKYIDTHSALIVLKQPDGTAKVEYIYEAGTMTRPPTVPLGDDGMSIRVIRTGEVVWIKDRAEAASLPRLVLDEDTGETLSMIYVPLNVRGKTIGCLSVQSLHENAYHEREVSLIAAIARHLAVAVENQRMYQALARQADVDTLTGLATHAKLLRTIDESLKGATASDPVCVMYCNVINFSMITDTYGYAEGDRILQMVARNLNALAGDDVLVGRLSGDHFLLVAAARAAETIGPLIQHTWKAYSSLSYNAKDREIPIALDCGYALAPIDSNRRGELLQIAVHRAELSRIQGGCPIGSSDVDVGSICGSFGGVEPIVEALLNRDPFIRLHLVHVNALASAWGASLELSPGDLRVFVQAALLHDVGKLLVSEHLLSKPTSLNASEYRIVQNHARYGANILSSYPAYAEVSTIVGQHHERFDGTGYPLRLAGEQIHPLARALSVIDVFSAMVMDRPYHLGVSEEAAIAELERCSGTQLDPNFVRKFTEYRHAHTAATG